MIAKQLEFLLANEIRNTEISQRTPEDMAQRFKVLRQYRLLPNSRGRNTQHLSPQQVAAGILSTVSTKPGYAGLTSLSLLKLRPVGGAESSFFKCTNFSEAIETILTNKDALKNLLEVRVSDSEIYTNGYGRACIIYEIGEQVHLTYYVMDTAVSLLQSGAEKNYNPRDLISSVITETVFYPLLFKRIQSELEKEKDIIYIGDLSEEEEDEIKKSEVRAKKLRITSSSRFLNLGVDNQVTWPDRETLVEFDDHTLVLMPKTKDNTTSVHIDLHGNRLGIEDARTLISRFLSLMSWCDDQFAVLQDGWAGNPVPVAVAKRNLAFTTAFGWIFDRKAPSSQEAKKAIAIYREGRNAEQNYLVSYAVLCYYKIIELRHKGRSDARTWFRENYKKLKETKHLLDRIEKFEEKLGGREPGDYLYDACRGAVAHANKPYSSDPDDFNELRRLHTAAAILRALARTFIKNELKVSDCSFDGS